MKPAAKLLAGAVTVVALVLATRGNAQEGKTPAGKREKKNTAAVERGKYLVTISGCNDCHTPFKMGEKFPEPDMTRMLSGHPESLKMPDAPKAQSPWGMVAAETNTAWAGPWGVSFTANLTPDETGLGTWTEQNFIDAIRSGRHMGRGRPILPPMPWPMIRNMTDQDLKAVFAYLQTIPPIKNRVPEPRLEDAAVGGSGSPQPK